MMIERILHRMARIGGLFVLVVLVFGLMVMLWMWNVGARVDQDGGPVPTWLPAGVTDLHLRGTRGNCEFSGRCPQPVIEAWASQYGIPIITKRRGRVYVIDFGKVPKNWTSQASFLTDESIRIYVEDAEELVWELRGDNGGGVTLTYVPNLQAFFGNRSRN